MEKIWLSSPHMSGKEVLYATDAIESNWVAPLGPYVNKMESMISEKIGVKDTALLSSGTAAIHLALRLLHITQEDFVFCQSMTFSASANPIIYENAIPVFIDSEVETWNMCPEALETALKKHQKIGKLPKAIIVVHLYGMPAKMDEIISLAERYGIPIIEDAAEAIGSKYKTDFCGSFGAFGILSFNGNKLITTSGGGALLSNNQAAIVKSRFLASQAKDPAPHYEHSELGFNYRMSNVSAAIGCAQLEVLEERIKARRANFEFYKNELSDFSFLKFQKESKYSFSNRWLSCVLFEKGKTPEATRLYLEKHNIETRPLWKPMHLQPIFKSFSFFGLGVSEDLFNRGLCLPSGSNLSLEEKARTVDLIKKSFSN